jgi:hypothetical protein
VATIRIEADSTNNPHSCKDRKLPVRNGSYFEYQDATEEELAFWNVLSANEKLELTIRAHNRCFFDELREFMKQEANKAKKIAEDNARAEQIKPGVPPESPPPSPSGPNQPPILGIGSAL